MDKKQLLARAKELDIQVPSGATNKEISALIAEKEATLVNETETARTDTQIIADQALEIEALEKKLFDSNLKIDSKDEDIESLTASLETKNTEVEVLLTTVEKLQAKLAEASTKTVDNNKPTYKGYAFKVKSFRFQAEKHFAEKAIKNEELMERLIKAKYIGLEKIK